VIQEACKGPSVVPSLILHKAGLVAWPVPTHYRSVAFSRSRARAGLCGTRSPVKRGAIRLAARLGDLWPNSPARHRPCKPQAAPAVAGCRHAQDHLAIAPITGLIDPSDPSPPGNRRARAAPMRDKCSAMPTPIQRAAVPTLPGFSDTSPVCETLFDVRLTNCRRSVRLVWSAVWLLIHSLLRLG
jgi:hypothetical protein